jgi:hypothetical protein
VPIKGVLEAVNIVEPKLKIAIVGDTGLGKSWLACSIAADDHKVLDIDFDGRAASLAGKKNVFVKSYVDRDHNNPNAISDLESDISLLEYDATKGALEYKTFVLDSGSYMRKSIEREIIRQQISLSRSIKIGTRTVRIGQGYDIFSGNVAYMENIIARFAVLGNVIITFHERNEKDEVKSTKEQKAFTGMVTIDPQHLSGILSTFNDVWRLTTDYASNRVLVTGLTDDFIGKTTLKGIETTVKGNENINIQVLLDKHRKAVAAGK